MNNNSQEYLQEIGRQIQRGNVALFIGAGASHSAGGPSGAKLTEMIKEEFPKINQSLNDFIEVCQDVIDTPPYNRNKLEEFIRSKLDLLQPTNAHRVITKYDWSSIFTTNFDDLIEVSYRTTEGRLKPCKAIYSERFQVNPSDRSKVYLFKIMGSMTAVEGESGHMVLSRADYNKALIRRRNYLELLLDFVKSGTMVFIGYSFKDRLVLDVIDEIIEIYGKDRVPWNYALFDQLQMDEKSQNMFSSRRIIPLECSFEEFFKYLEREYSVYVEEEKGGAEGVHLKLRGHDMEIKKDKARQYMEYFEVLNEEKINQDPGERDDFFKGINKSWGAFRERWDFQRELYISPEFKRTIDNKAVKGCFKDRVFNELKKYDSEDNKILLVVGMAGVGKTMMLRRLAYDVYRSGEAPVIIVNSLQTTLDYKLLANFIEELNQQLNQKVPRDQHTPQLKPVIIIDDAASVIWHINGLRNYLTSRGRAALIIAAERKGEWNLKQNQVKIPEDNLYGLDEELSDQEKNKIIDHFYDIGYIPTKGTHWDDIIKRDFESSFFATVYTLVHPSRKPLNEIIQDQYQNLTGLTQKAFRYVCCFHQFNLPVNMELLVRSLKLPYSDFHSEVIAKDGDRVIFEEPDAIGNLLYRSHHRIIAKKTVDFFFGDPEIQKGIFIEILKNANLANRKEREICEKLLVGYIGPNAKPQVFTYEQQRQIFRTICENNPIRSLVHHWGILEADDRQCVEAERLLKQALKLPREDIESYRGESDQTILTSLGNLYSHMGIEFVKQGKQIDAGEYFKKAESYFRDAKYGEFPNSHAYHAHANMWYLRGNEAKEEPEKLRHYTKALEILMIAKDNIGEDILQAIYELEIQIWTQVGDETKIQQNLETLRDKFDTASGYYLHAQLLWRKAHQEEDKNEREKLLKLALRKITKGLNYFPNDEHCLHLQAKLMKELKPDNLNEYYETLRKWKAAISLPNAWLLYEMARTAFLLGYYDYSKKFFEELEAGVGIGHKLRSRPRYPILDETGNKKAFEGVVANILSSYEGEIRCESLRSLRYPIAFRPIACGFTPSPADLVRFHIAFSFRGPIAVEVRKI